MRPDREAAVFVRRGDQFLMLHRATDDYWHVVAGGAEEGETFAECASRELLEETGLHAAVADLAMPQAYAIPAEMKDLYAPSAQEVEIHNFVVEAPPEWEPMLNEEHDDYRWCGLADAMALAHWPETREILAVIATPKRKVH